MKPVGVTHGLVCLAAYLVRQQKAASKATPARTYRTCDPSSGTDDHGHPSPRRASRIVRTEAPLGLLGPMLDRSLEPWLRCPRCPRLQAGQLRGQPSHRGTPRVLRNGRNLRATEPGLSECTSFPPFLRRVYL